MLCGRSLIGQMTLKFIDGRLTNSINKLYYCVPNAGLHGGLDGVCRKEIWQNPKLSPNTGSMGSIDQQYREQMDRNIQRHWNFIPECAALSSLSTSPEINCMGIRD